jgi:hypothetical protein
MNYVGRAQDIADEEGPASVSKTVTLVKWADIETGIPPQEHGKICFLLDSSVK